MAGFSSSGLNLSSEDSHSSPHFTAPTGIACRVAENIKPLSVARVRTRSSALPGLEAAVRFIDDVNAAFAAHQAVVAMAPTQRFQRVPDLHRAHRSLGPQTQHRPQARLPSQQSARPGQGCPEKVGATYGGGAGLSIRQSSQTRSASRRGKWAREVRFRSSDFDCGRILRQVWRMRFQSYAGPGGTTG